MFRFKRHIALMLSFVMLLSLIKIDVSVAETLETSISKLLIANLKKNTDINGNVDIAKVNLESRLIVRDTFIGDDYELINGMVISFSILRDYEKAVYVYPYQDISTYKGDKDLKNGEYRYLGYRKDESLVTNPKYMDDATSSVPLKNKKWYNFNANGVSFAGARDEQIPYLFGANLYDPIGTNKRPLGFNVRELLENVITNPSDKVLKTFTQMGSAPTLNNEGSIMLKHITSRGGEYYDSFTVEPLDLGVTYATEISCPDVKFLRDDDGNLIDESIQATVTVITAIDFSETELLADVIYQFDNQDILYDGRSVRPSYSNGKLLSQFDITLYAKDFSAGENIVPLTGYTELMSIYGDEKTLRAEGNFKVIKQASALEADFDIINGDDIVNDSIFSVGTNVVKIRDDETDKEAFKRLDLSYDLKLVATKTEHGEDIEELARSWYIKDLRTGFYELLSHEESDVIQTIDKNNIDKYVDDEGNIEFKLNVIGTLNTSAEVDHSTVMKINYKNIPLVSSNKPPVAFVKSRLKMKAGTYTSFSGLDSYDKDGYITDYEFNGYSGFRIKKIDSRGSGGGGTPLMMGRATIRLKVTDNSALSGSYDHRIDVVSPIGHKQVFRGTPKVNRKITLDSTRDTGTTYYPSSLFETSWEILPMQGQSVDSIKWDTDNQGNLVDVLFKEEGIYTIRKTVSSRCTFPGDEDLIISETVEKGIKIYPDEEPIAQFSTVKYNLRQLLDGGYSTIRVYDTSYSPDMDKIYKRVWLYKYDSDNDGDFEDETIKLFDYENDLKEIALRVKDVGKYQFELRIEEDYTDETIDRFISTDDILKDNTDDINIENKTAEVLNVAPIVKLEEKANKKVEVIIATDYSASKRANLEGEINLLTKSMQEKKLNMIPYMVNTNDEGNSIIIGQQESPVYNYTRKVSAHFRVDEVEKWGISDYRETISPAWWGTTFVIASTDKTESEARSLPTYPLATYKNFIRGWLRIDNSSSSHTRGYTTHNRIEIYDEPNLLNVKKVYDLNTYYSSSGSSYEYRDFGGGGHTAPTPREERVIIDKEFKKGAQVGTKFEDIYAINVDKIKSIELDDTSDKYLVILTDGEDTTKSIDDKFIEYVKSKGFKVRYSIPKIANESTVEGIYISDLRLHDDSIIVKSKYNNYFEIGNDTNSGVTVYPKEVTDEDKISLFDENVQYKEHTRITASRTGNMHTVVSLTRGRNVSNIIFGGWSLIDHRDDNSVWFKGEKILDDVTEMFPTPLGVFFNTPTGAKLYYQSGRKAVLKTYWQYHEGRHTTSELTYSLIDTELDNITSIGYKKTSHQTTYHTIGKYNYHAFNIFAVSENNKMYHLRGNTRFSTYPYVVYKNSYDDVAYIYDGYKISDNTVGDEIYPDNDKAFYWDKIAYSYNGNDYDDGKIYAYIKDGKAYAKGFSRTGQLGVVKSNVAEYTNIYNNGITLDDSLIDKNFVSADKLLYSPESSKYANKEDTLGSISNDYADYTTSDTIYKLLGESLEFETFYFDFEGDPLEESRYDYSHEEIFDNSMGIDEINGRSTSELVSSYDKVGKYVISPKYKDNPKDISVFKNYWLWNQDNTKINLIIHRKPIALARYSSKTLTSNNYEICLKDDDSYDIDHESMTSKGIVEWLWFVKDIDTLETRLFGGKSVKFIKNKSERLSVGLKVKDMEGEWSDYAYMDIDSVPMPKIKVEFEIKASDENLSIDRFPASESLDIHEIKTSHANPIYLETYIEDANGLRTLLYREDSEELIRASDGASQLVGIIKEDDETIEWTNQIYNTLKSYRDANYKIILKALDKTYPSNFTEKERELIIESPINLSAIVPDEIVSGSDYLIESYASKYTDKVNMKVYDASDKLIMDTFMNYESSSENDNPLLIKKKFTKELASSSFDIEGQVRFEFEAIIESEPEKREELIKRSNYISLAISYVNLYGDWSKWDGQTDLRGNTLVYNPRRFLSFERIYIDVRTIGSPDSLYLDLSDELKAMSFTDDKGNIYRYADFLKYEVEFPLEFRKITDNDWTIDYVLPLAESTISFENERLREAYSLSVIANKASSSAIYTIDKDSDGGGIEITLNVYEHYYIQKK